MYRLFLSDFNEAWIFSADFRKIIHSSTNFHENPSNASRVVPWERTDGQTGVTKLRVATTKKKARATISSKVVKSRVELHSVSCGRRASCSTLCGNAQVRLRIGGWTVLRCTSVLRVIRPPVSISGRSRTAKDLGLPYVVITLHYS
jgi:hypothetical protein